MQSLGILHIQHQLVGDQVMSLISSGQRKRVSIAMELIAAPMMLFLDEPTSGLDSTTAMALIELLKKISGTGVIVVCILHQPRQEIFDALDHVMLMAEGVQLYEGSPEEAAGYFRSHGFELAKDANSADRLLDIAASKANSASPHIGTVNMVQQLARIWEQQQCIQHEAIHHTKDNTERNELSPDIVEDLERTAALRGASWLRQVQYCHVRAMKQQLRQPVSLLLEIAIGGVAGLLIGLGLYSNNGMHFQGVYLTPFEMLSSAVDYSTVPKIGNMITLAIGTLFRDTMSFNECTNYNAPHSSCSVSAWCKHLWRRKYV
jgi:ABC-type sugar transport system ATPase subunit